MTLRPVEQQRIGKGKNGPRITIPTAQDCQNPDCGYLATDRHHCIAGGMGGPRWDWIEIDGVVRQNIVFLCTHCHQKVTENKVKIWWDDGEWCWGSPGVSLSPPLGSVAQPPGSGHTSEREGGSQQRLSAEETPPPSAHESPGPDSMLAEVEPREGSPGPGPGEKSGKGFAGSIPASVSRAEQPGVGRPGGTDHPHREISPGETCPTCQRRVNHPPKADSPKSKTVSFRVPEDERESFDVLFADAAEHLGIAGHKYEKKTVIEYGLALILQGPEGELAE